MSDDRQKQTSLSPVVIKARFLENYYSSFKDKDYVKFINADNFAKQAYEFVDASICKNEISFTNLQKQFLLKTFQKMYDQPETVQHLITTMYLAKLMTDEIDKKHSFKENFKMSKSDFVFAFIIAAGVALAEIHHPAAAAALVHQHKPETHNQDHGQQGTQ